ncbi:Outer membrane lipoprotein Blc precursor [Pseudoruegeria aquimaris]|uniref:Outer membrane lipoprotein Blc n=1 Tax=Pseudoruegeria aquimaris TaxID=393663 RepID=A0A1Y5SGR8_9RHOB|nr:lipocalin family protein [Pseudoruegeria aquimaris]SLN40106.1 Outer membrane lipoprotein Blc precursor [Pseudoruegeria aquimaris]
MIFRTLAATALFALATAPAALADKYRDRDVPIAAVESLDVERYLGLWYEIARFPNWFEKGCAGVTAEYALREDGQISVVNTCRDGGLDGEVKQSEGVARVEAPGELSVTFVPWLPLPFVRGDYWVLDVTEGYDVAVVGNPKGSTGWILARTPQISDAQLAAAKSVLAGAGYDTSKLFYPQQPGN